MARLLLLVPTSTYRAEAFVKAAKRLDVDLSIASEVPSALSHLHPVSLPAFDFTDTQAAVAFMKDFATRSPIDAVVPVDDQATLAAAAVGEALGLAHNPPDAVAATRNKHLMRERMTKAGVRTPAFRAVATDADPHALATDLDFPVVVKPLSMAASRGVIRADDTASFVDVFQRVAAIVDAPDVPARGQLLIESYVPGWEVAVEGILTDGALHVFAIFDKPDPLEGPFFPETFYVTPSRLDATAQEGIIKVTGDTVRALGLRHGPVHAEVRGDDEGVTLIEIAARSIGGLCSRVLRFEHHLTIEDVILRHALAPHRPVPNREAGACGVMMMQAPDRGRFDRVDGLDAARAIAGIDEIIISAHPGRELSPLPEGFLYLGFIFARGPSPKAVEASLRDAFARLNVIIAA